jgi:hypothetical protein
VVLLSLLLPKLYHGNKRGIHYARCEQGPSLILMRRTRGQLTPPFFFARVSVRLTKWRT